MVLDILFDHDERLKSNCPEAFHSMDAASFTGAWQRLAKRVRYRYPTVVAKSLRKVDWKSEELRRLDIYPKFAEYSSPHVRLENHSIGGSL